MAENYNVPAANSESSKSETSGSTIFGRRGDLALRTHFAIMMVFAGGVAFWAFLALVYADQTAAETNIQQFQLGLPFAAVMLVAYGLLIMRSARVLEQQGFFRGLANRVCSLTNNGYVLWDTRRQKIYLSYSLLRLLGIREAGQGLALSAFASIVHADDRQALGELNAWMSDNNSPHDTHTCEFRLQHVSGDWRWLRVMVTKVPSNGRTSQVNAMGVFTDIEGEVDQALRHQSDDARIREAINSLPEAFALRDRNDRLVMCNKKFASLHGIPEEATHAGARFSEMMAAAANDPASNAVSISNSDSVERSDQVVQLADGRWISISQHRTRDGGHVMVETDISQLKDQELLLKQQYKSLRTTLREQKDLASQYLREKERAEEASKAKSAFLANVSHELRTPLNAVLGFTDLMKREAFGQLGRNKVASTKYSGYVSDIYESGQYLLELIDGVLDMSRIESGKTDLNIRPVRVNDVVLSCLRTTSAIVEAKNLRITKSLKLKRDLPCDEHSLRRIILNVLSNAIKFTPTDGSVHIATGSRGSNAFIEIKDNGVGIPKQLLPKLGQPFLKTESEHSDAGGTGLGLALCHKMVNIHQGKLEIGSEVGEGTIVRVILPFTQDASVTPSSASNDSEASDSAVA